jgi:hypothetical protein
VTHRARHLQERRLFESYLAVRSGEGLDPPIADHLTDCPECSRRYAELTQFMEALSIAATDEADAVFTPERLHLQQQQIARRLEHVGHPARVISFPGRASVHRVAVVAPRFARRWVAASLAAGLFVGVGTGMLLDRQASRAFGTRRPGPTHAVITTTPSGIELPQDPSEGDEAFLSEIEVAGQRPRIRELLAIDALTPHAREVEITLR